MSKRSWEKVCSLCDEVKSTVDRELFDGMCAECTSKALYDERIVDIARKKNKKIKKKL